MRGRVASDGREAMLPLTVIGSSGILAEVEATVDTGFTGSLCLPPDVVHYLSVPFIGRGVAVLADGQSGLAPRGNKRARRWLARNPHGRLPPVQHIRNSHPRVADPLRG
jgi:hypothetical protein